MQLKHRLLEFFQGRRVKVKDDEPGGGATPCEAIATVEREFLSPSLMFVQNNLPSSSYAFGETIGPGHTARYAVHSSKLREATDG